MPGLRERVYLGGVNLTRGPFAAVPKTEKAVRHERLADTTLVTHSLWPEAGDPDLTAKFVWALDYQKLTTVDRNVVTRFVGSMRALDFCPWIPVAEEWTFAAGESYSGILLRRNALAVVSPLPVNAATKYPLAAQLNGATLAVTLGTVADYRTPWTAAGTASEGDVVNILYWAAFRVKLTEDEPRLDPFTQGHNLTLSEV